ncbi:hypothetical protein CsSME_00036346 [Camellia sinensis var. sinensis]
MEKNREMEKEKEREREREPYLGSLVGWNRDGTGSDRGQHNGGKNVLPSNGRWLPVESENENWQNASSVAEPVGASKSNFNKQNA